MFLIISRFTLSFSIARSVLYSKRVVLVVLICFVFIVGHVALCTALSPWIRPLYTQTPSITPSEVSFVGTHINLVRCVPAKTYRKNSSQSSSRSGDYDISNLLCPRTPPRRRVTVQTGWYLVAWLNL
jgi:hypothetical protein